MPRSLHDTLRHLCAFVDVVLSAYDLSSTTQFGTQLAVNPNSNLRKHHDFNLRQRVRQDKITISKEALAYKMEELYHRCKTNAPMDFLFTTMSGHVVEVNSWDLPNTSPYSPRFDPKIKVPTMEQRGPFTLPASVLTYLKSKNLQVDSTDGSSDPKLESPGHCSTSATCPPLMVVSRTASSPSSLTGAKGSTGSSQVVTLSTVYNEYGELVNAYDILHPPRSKDMSTLQILRIIKKGFHHNYKTKIGKVISLQMEGKSSLIVDDGSCILNVRISAWEFKPRSPKSVKSVTLTSPSGSCTEGETPAVAVYNGPPRVLEIGCGDGSWCFQVKEQYPDWIIEALDDTDHWSCAYKEVVLKDFMVSDPTKPTTDYFRTIHTSQEYPEFTVRNINQLLKHQIPIPHNLYGLIRARDVFDKIVNWKTFLEDVRLILQPDGVVEFLEVDPRPRLIRAGRSHSDTKEDHTSGPKTDWTDDIADRFKNKSDEQLGTEVPGWMGRVTEDLKATLRPRDGVPGPNLKSWLEGSGFWDVKQTIIRLPVGGDSKAGQLMKDYILLKHEHEDEIPNLKNALPVIEKDAIESGDYYLNLHIVTGRKPCHPRAGDLLLNGSRQEMTASKYEAMARTEDPKSNQWKRFDLDGELTGLVHGLYNLSGAPPIFSPPAALTPSLSTTGKLSPLLTHDGAVDVAGEIMDKGNEKSEVVEFVEAVGNDKDEGKKFEVLPVRTRQLISELAVEEVEVAGPEAAS